MKFLDSTNYNVCIVGDISIVERISMDILRILFHAKKEQNVTVQDAM